MCFDCKCIITKQIFVHPVIRSTSTRIYTYVHRHTRTHIATCIDTYHNFCNQKFSKISFSCDYFLYSTSVYEIFHIMFSYMCVGIENVNVYIMHISFYTEGSLRYKQLTVPTLVPLAIHACMHG